jgi:hypothetical protein
MQKTTQLNSLTRFWGTQFMELKKTIIRSSKELLSNHENSNLRYYFEHKKKKISSLSTKFKTHESTIVKGREEKIYKTLCTSHRELSCPKTLHDVFEKRVTVVNRPKFTQAVWFETCRYYSRYL